AAIPDTASTERHERISDCRPHSKRSAMAQKNDAGRNTKADSLAVTANAAVAPTRMPSCAFGLSSHSRKANKLDRNMAVTGKSVVARPACANSGGVVAMISAVATAATPPKARHAQT